MRSFRMLSHLSAAELTRYYLCRKYLADISFFNLYVEVFESETKRFRQGKLDDALQAVYRSGMWRILEGAACDGVMRLTAYQ